MMSKYQRGKIYALRSPHTEKIYIGSTCSPLYKRFHQHKNNYTNWKNGKYHYVSSFEILEAGGAYIELIKNCPCNSKEELNREEGITIRATDCVNKLIAGRTRQEWVEDNREHFLEYHRQYYQDNKEQIRKLNRQLYQDNKEQRVEYQRQHYQENKEQILEKQKQYNKENKEEISKRRKEKVGCVICKCMITKQHFKRHTQSPKHQAKKEEYEERRFLNAFRKSTIDDPEFNEYFKQFEYVQDEK